MNQSICMIYGIRSEQEGGEHFWWGGAHQVQIIVVPWQTEPALMSWGAEAVAGFRYQLWIGPFLRFEWLVFIYRDCPPVNASLSGVKISTLIPVSSISSIARSYIKEKTICLAFFDPNGPLPEGGGCYPISWLIGSLLRTRKVEIEWEKIVLLWFLVALYSHPINKNDQDISRELRRSQSRSCAIIEGRSLVPQECDFSPYQVRCRIEGKRDLNPEEAKIDEMNWRGCS